MKNLIRKLKLRVMMSFKEVRKFSIIGLCVHVNEHQCIEVLRNPRRFDTALTYTK